MTERRRSKYLPPDGYSASAPLRVLLVVLVGLLVGVGVLATYDVPKAEAYTTPVPESFKPVSKATEEAFKKIIQASYGQGYGTNPTVQQKAQQILARQVVTRAPTVTSKVMARAPLFTAAVGAWTVVGLELYFLPCWECDPIKVPMNTEFRRATGSMGGMYVNCPTGSGPSVGCGRVAAFLTYATATRQAGTLAVTKSENRVHQEWVSWRVNSQTSTTCTPQGLPAGCVSYTTPGASAPQTFAGTDIPSGMGNDVTMCCYNQQTNPNPPDWPRPAMFQKVCGATCPYTGSQRGVQITVTAPATGTQQVLCVANQPCNSTIKPPTIESGAWQETPTPTQPFKVPVSQGNEFIHSVVADPEAPQVLPDEDMPPLPEPDPDWDPNTDPFSPLNDPFEDPEGDPDHDDIPNKDDPDPEEDGDPDEDGDPNEHPPFVPWPNTDDPEEDGDPDGDGDPDETEPDPEYNPDPTDPYSDPDEDGEPNETDPDNDEDGAPDEVDPNPYTPDPDTDGDGDIDPLDPDNDGDEIPDEVDPHPNTPDPDVDGDGVPNETDPDKDGDGVPNEDDEQPWVPDPDIDEDGDPNTTDPDDDGDGIPDEDDPEPWNPTDPGTLEPDHPWADPDEDGEPNINDPDDDGDGVPDETDPNPHNPNQPNPEPEPSPDNPQPDRDGDGVPDETDPAPDNPNEPFPTPEPKPDRDGDGTPDEVDPNPDNPNLPRPNPDPNPDPNQEPEPDTDGDGEPDTTDPDPEDPNEPYPTPNPQPDRDGDGTPDEVDQNPDNPNLPRPDPDSPENWPDADGDGTPDTDDPAPSDKDQPYPTPNPDMEPENPPPPPGECNVTPPQNHFDEDSRPHASSLFPFNLLIMAVDMLNTLDAAPQTPELPAWWEGGGTVSLSQLNSVAAAFRALFSVLGVIGAGFMAYQIVSQSKEGD